MNTNIMKKALRNKAKKVKSFFKENKGTILQLAAIMVAVPVMGGCSDADSIKIGALGNMVEPVVDTLTGPLPKLTVLSGVALYGMGYASQQLQNWKTGAVGLLIGGGIATGAGEVLDSLGISASACLF